MKATEPASRDFGVDSLYLFGSHARDQARPDSDVGVFIDPTLGQSFGFLDDMDAFEGIRRSVGDKVDYGTRTDCIRCCGREAIAGIRSVTAGQSPDEFASSWVTKRAIEHALLNTAEAAKHIPADLKAGQPKVPWSKIDGLGNICATNIDRLIRISSDRLSPITLIRSIGPCWCTSRKSEGLSLSRRL